METHDLRQGTPEWHNYRASHDNASDAPAMMGCSTYKTRDQLIAELATGVVPEVDPATQRRFDSGHRFEALARPMAEAIIGEDLYPVTGSKGRLSASFDGLTMLENVAWEHKRLNARLRAAMVEVCTGADLPMEYQIQMEQQCAVSACERVLFMASDWDAEGNLIDARHCWYTPNLDLRARIFAGWEQLHKDVAAYVAPDAAPAKIVAEAVTALPAVFAQVTGSIALKDNLPEYEVALRDFIEHRLITKPESDQDFANLDLQIKALKGAEAALDASEEQALSQAEMLSAFKRQKDMLHKLTRDTRLAAEKLLTAEKERIKLEQVQRGQREFAAHIGSLNARLGKPYMPTVPSDFAGAIKGKRTVDSLRSAVNDELARAKLAANEIADRIQVNLTTLRELASEHAFLFADTATIVLKAPDDLTTLAKARIADHQAKEAARLEAERERIQQEEKERADREAREKLIADERAAQEAIAQAAQQNQIAQPVAADLSGLVTERRAEAVAEIDARQAINTAQRSAAAAPAVAPVRAAPASVAPTTPPSLKLGAIADRLGFSLSADFLRSLGFEPAAKVGAHGVYHEAQFPEMLAALVRHIEGVQAKAAA